MIQKKRGQEAFCKKPSGKTGQVSTFMIVGLIILIVVALIFVARDYVGIGISSEKFLSIKMEPIKDSIFKCVDVNAKDTLDLIGKQGGTLNPQNSIFYNGYKVNYLCTNLNGRRECANRMMLLSDIEKELNDDLKNKIKNCAQVQAIGNAMFYDVKVGEFDMTTNILDNSVNFNITYPITLTKGETKQTIKEFVRKVDVPLGSLYGYAANIINYQAIYGDFNRVPEMINSKGAIEINIAKPYPDIVYILNKRDSNYIFQFGVEGE